jgi:hypothetical protein
VGSEFSVADDMGVLSSHTPEQGRCAFPGAYSGVFWHRP